MYRLLFFLSVTSIFAFDLERGPGYQRNSILNQFIFFEFYPQKASLNKKDFNLIHSLSHSSIIRMRNNIEYITFSDMEITHLTFNPSYRLSENLEVSLNVGILHYWAGFLDGFVQWYHKKFNFPNGQRGFVKNFDTTHQLGQPDNLIVDRNKGTTSLRDTFLMLRYQLIKSNQASRVKSFAIALAGAVEFPTGKKHLGTSNGGYDWGLGLYSEKGFFSDLLYVYYLTSVIKLGEYKGKDINMPLKKYKTQHSISFEMFPRTAISSFVQVDYSSSPYNTKSNIFFDSSPINIVLGLNFLKNKRKNSMWQFLFVQDLTHKTTPDFMFKLSIFQGF